MAQARYLDETFAPLSPDQAEALRALENGEEHLFITGKAGTGKSVLLRYFLAHTGLRVAVLAPTGLAALHIKAQTIHSFFHLSLAVQKPQDAAANLTQDRKELFRALDMLIIDEVSMVRADTMRMIDATLRAARDSERLFGGCRLAVFGDLCQLPPVAGKSRDLSEYLYATYHTAYFYGAFPDGFPFRLIELTTVFRQKDETFIRILNRIREGTQTNGDLDILNTACHRAASGPAPVTLTATNRAAETINARALSALPGAEHTYEGRISGEFPFSDMPTSRSLRLREGARIMMIRNDPEHRWVNGSMGTVFRLTENEVWVTLGDAVYPVSPVIWTRYAYHYDRSRDDLLVREAGTFIQYPIRLAYAITIHKSQGQSFDAVRIDLSQGGAFAPGQAYVALSRCRSMEGLCLTAPLSAADIRISPEVTDFLAGCRSSGRRGSLLLEKRHRALCSRTFADAQARLEKPAREKVARRIEQILHDPSSPEACVTGPEEDDLYTSRVDENLDLVFSAPRGQDFLAFLYAGSRGHALRFAHSFRLQVNPGLGALQLLPKAPPETLPMPDGTPASRLSQFSEADLDQLGIPRSLRPEMLSPSFSRDRLEELRPYMPSRVMDALSQVLHGATVKEAMACVHASGNGAAIPETEPFFREASDRDLIRLGIPGDLLGKVRAIRSESALNHLTRTLPCLSRQALYALHAGESPETAYRQAFASASPCQPSDYASALDSPVTLSEFAPACSHDALRAFVDYPSEKWRVFLHPLQSASVTQNYPGPARVIGGAGTGKSVVLVHRARRLAQACTGGSRVLVTTFGKTLTYDLDTRLREICTPEELRHISVFTCDQLTRDLARTFLQETLCYASSAYGAQLRSLWGEALSSVSLSGTLTPEFCLEEWRDVIQAQRLETPEAYYAANRTGRGRPFPRQQRPLFLRAAERYQQLCRERHLTDLEWAQNRLSDFIRDHRDLFNYTSVLVDECQDLRLPALRLLRALAGEPHENDMYLTGDSRQRIYCGRIPLSQSGIIVNNRSRVLSLNYRTTEEIYRYAMRLQAGYVYDDLDGSPLGKEKCVCIFHGPVPTLRHFPSTDRELDRLALDIRSLLDRGTPEREICVLLRRLPSVSSVALQLRARGITCLVIDHDTADVKEKPGVRVMTMHRGKGMEYSCVFLPMLNAEIIPSPQELARAESSESFRETLKREANLLSVAITRARHQVWLSSGGEPSMFIGGKPVPDPFPASL